ncbi:zinc finger, C3HC4 type (RING finger) domain protein, partial [Toxoplasma gondii MAS]
SQALRNHLLVCRTLGSVLPDAGNDEAGDGETDSDRFFCVICRESRRRGEGFKRLPCSHSFHFACLQQWLTASSNIICPV